MVALVLFYLAFSLYFLLRLLIVSPFFPNHTHRTPPISYPRLVTISCLPLFLFIPSPLHVLPYAITSYSLAVLAALRFVHDAPLSLTHPPASSSLSLLIWRVDLLIFLLLLCFVSLTHSPSYLKIAYSALLAVAASHSAILNLRKRALARSQQPSPLALLRLAFSRHSRLAPPIADSHLPLKVPPTIRDCSAFTLLSFEWVTPLLATGRQMPLEDFHIPQLANRFCSISATRRFESFWTLQLNHSHHSHRTHHPSLIRALIRSYGIRFLLCGVIKLFADAVMFTSPILLRMVIQHFQRREEGLESPAYGIFLACALFASYLMQSILTQQYFNILYTVHALVRGSLVSAVFSKSTRLSSNSLSQSTTGRIQNLMSTDCRTIANFSMGVHDLWSSLEQIVVAMVLLIRLLGPIPALSAVLCVLCSIPLQIFLFRRITALRDQKLTKTDERIKHVSEAIKGIKLVKLYSWEVPFIRRIRTARNQELGLLRRISVLGAWNKILTASLSTAITIIAFAVYVLKGNLLDAAVIFPAIAIFKILQPSLLFFPNMVIAAARSMASLSRLRKFLLLEELRSLSDQEQPMDQEAMEFNQIDLAAEKASFSWDPTCTMLSLKMGIDEVCIPTGSLVAVIGSTGSGKSTLLAGFLGEVSVVSGKVSLRRGRKVSYCDQVPFIQNTTLRENILFGRSFIKEQYEAAIRVTGLVPDINQLPAGDSTEIGSRGVNLSGGQRARVSLARAVYADADIVFLDDPLSAVDAQVGRSIFVECFVSKLRGKTRLFTTNQIRLAASHEVDFIIVIKEGVLIEFGSKHELLSKSESEFARLVRSSGSLIERPGRSSDASLDIRSLTIGANGSMDQGISPADKPLSGEEATEHGKHESSALLEKEVVGYEAINPARLTTKEAKKEGTVKAQHYMSYLSGMGVYRYVVPYIILTVAAHSFGMAKDVWLSLWSDRAAADQSLDNLLIFLLLGVATIIIIIGGAFTLVFGMLRASVTLHDTFLVSVFGAPCSFFNATPDGRIVNRFSSDMEKLDSGVGTSLSGLLRVFLNLSFSLVIILWTIPTFVVVVIPVSMVCYLIQEYYRRSIVDLRRLEAISYSPLYSHFAEMLDGVVTIRAYGDVQRSCHTNTVHIDKLSKTSFAASSARRWLTIRMNVLGNALIFAATVMAVILPTEKVSTGMKGLMLSYTIGVTSVMRWGVRQFTETESQLSAVERIAEYSTFSQEEQNGLEDLLLRHSLCPERLKISKDTQTQGSRERIGDFLPVDQPHTKWLQTGNIEFHDVKMSYRADLKPALREVTFSIRGGEHIGIVGRTGAGKTSAIHSLFRLYELEQGTIRIDGTDVSSLSLYKLRPSLGIIPQEPVCFSGTIRSNLDIFSQYSDERVQRALDLCGLQDCMREPVTLDFQVMENGTNLSVGQRQLLCLGRALLRDSPVLVLDEATSSVSDEFDARIQRTLREEMGHCTILTVAHRLHTVIQSDRIFVMDQGRIVETGSPAELLHCRSRFSAMVDELGADTAAQLRNMTRNLPYPSY